MIDPRAVISPQAHLAADVLRFSEDFDREPTRTYFAFQLDGAALDRRDAGDIARGARKAFKLGQ